jgi:hypothetical protein
MNELVALKQRDLLAIRTFHLETTLRELRFEFNAEKAVPQGIHRNLAMRKLPFAFGTVEDPAGHLTPPLQADYHRNESGVNTVFELGAKR